MSLSTCAGPDRLRVSTTRPKSSWCGRGRAVPHVGDIVSVDHEDFAVKEVRWQLADGPRVVIHTAADQRFDHQQVEDLRRIRW